MQLANTRPLQSTTPGLHPVSIHQTSPLVRGSKHPIISDPHMSAIVLCEIGYWTVWQTHSVAVTVSHTAARIWLTTWDADFSFFVLLRLLDFNKLGLQLQPLKISRLRLQVKVGHRLLNLCDCDSVLSERCRQTNSQTRFSKNNNNPILLRSYLNRISVITCSKMVIILHQQNLNY